MLKIETTDGFQWAERFAYIIFAVLLFAWASVSDIEMDFRVIGLGYIDPFFSLGVAWIGVVFIMKGTIAMLQRRSYRGMSDEWKGPLTDYKPDKVIGHALKDGKVAVNQLAIFPTGGTSKPSVRGFTGTRFIVFPNFYSVVLGGYVIIMTKLHTYPKGTHGDLLSHIITTMNKQKGFRQNHTRIAVGENPDPKWAVEVNGEWIVRKAPGQSVNMMREASICRKHNDFIDDANRSRIKLSKPVYQPPEE